MFDFHWSASEKKLARRVFDEALKKVLEAEMADFKTKAAAVYTPSDMWAIETHLRERHRESDEMFDYRYSQLPLVFANLINRSLVDETELEALSVDKLKRIRSILSAFRER
jgi:Photoprotection regulator fluorescence recovery protein